LQPIDYSDIKNVKSPPRSGALCVGETSLSAVLSVHVGDVIVGTDGYRVESAEQFRVLRDKQDATVPLQVIYWDGTAYQQTGVSGDVREMGIRLETYHPE
jgi:hypothetical protein